MSIVAERTSDVKEIHDSIAEQYIEFKNKPYRTAVEQYTFLDCMILPNESQRTKGSRILDLACGNGHYTRKIHDLFPDCSYLCGVDISSVMIDVAKAHESELRQGIDYICADGRNLPVPEQPYDFVTAAYYLNFAQTRDELRAMIKNIYDQLKPGGTFYAMNDNVNSAKECFNNPMHKKYSFYRETSESNVRDGMPIKYTYYWDMNTPSSCVFYDYYFSPSVYEELFKECGFSSFEWVPAKCNPKIDDPAFFDDLMRWPHIIGIIARK